jgi:hypothetical protein
MLQPFRVFSKNGGGFILSGLKQGVKCRSSLVTWPQVDVPGNSKASELKDFMARELQVSPYTFKLQLDLGMVFDVYSGYPAVKQLK